MGLFVIMLHNEILDTWDDQEDEESLDTLSYLEPKQFMPISRNISSRILALPIYLELAEEE